MENTPKPGDTSRLLPSLAFDSFSLQLPSTSNYHQVPPPVPRIPIPSKRSGKLVRPSTASAVEERTSLLPSTPYGPTVEVIASESSLGKEHALQKGVTLGAQGDDRKVTSAKNLAGNHSQSTLGVYSYRYSVAQCSLTSNP
jgi:hypothetical protein